VSQAGYGPVAAKAQLGLHINQPQSPLLLTLHKIMRREQTFWNLGNS